jgi:protein-L-isoaspartate O-methyltransferase
VAAGDPTGWFDQLYAAGAAGQIQMPWGRTEPHSLLTAWAEGRTLDGAGQRAIVVGCALGADAEYISSLGFDTVGFDISDTAIRLARQRHPGSEVRYVTADLLDLPPQWRRGYDLVVEIITVQAMPVSLHRQAIAGIAGMVAGGRDAARYRRCQRRRAASCAAGAMAAAARGNRCLRQRRAPAGAGQGAARSGAAW